MSSTIVGAFLFALVAFLLRETSGNEDAKRLYDDLMVNYNRFTRPTATPQETIRVQMKLRLSQIIDVVSFN